MRYDKALSAKNLNFHFGVFCTGRPLWLDSLILTNYQWSSTWLLDQIGFPVICIWNCINIQKLLRSINKGTSLILQYGVEGCLELANVSTVHFNGLVYVSLLTWVTLQIRIWFVRQSSNPTLEQTNKQERNSLLDKIWTHCATNTLYFRFDILDTPALSKVSTSLDKDHISRFVMKYFLHILIFLLYWSFKKGNFLFSMFLTTKTVGVFAKNIRLFRKLFPKQSKHTTFTSCFVMLDSFLNNF